MPNLVKAFIPLDVVEIIKNLQTSSNASPVYQETVHNKLTSDI